MSAARRTARSSSGAGFCTGCFSSERRRPRGQGLRLLFYPPPPSVERCGLSQMLAGRLRSSRRKPAQLSRRVVRLHGILNASDELSSNSISGRMLSPDEHLGRTSSEREAGPLPAVSQGTSEEPWPTPSAVPKSKGAVWILEADQDCS